MSNDWSIRGFPQKKRDIRSLSIHQAIAKEPITQIQSETHRKIIPLPSKANTFTNGFTAIVKTGEKTSKMNVCEPT